MLYGDKLRIWRCAYSLQLFAHDLIYDTVQFLYAVTGLTVALPRMFSPTNMSAPRTHRSARWRGYGCFQCKHPRRCLQCCTQCRPPHAQRCPHGRPGRRSLSRGRLLSHHVGTGRSICLAGHTRILILALLSSILLPGAITGIPLKRRLTQIIKALKMYDDFAACCEFTVHFYSIGPRFP